jgi:hypothetical protein
MVKAPAQISPKSWLWGSLTSIRLTVFLLLILAAVAVIGTVVPQDQPPGWYLRRYGDGLGGLISGGGLARIYYSPWFLGPMGLLAFGPGGWTVRLLGASPRHREEFAASLERLLTGFNQGTPS